jgi:hypothetical protein
MIDPTLAMSTPAAATYHLSPRPSKSPEGRFHLESSVVFQGDQSSPRNYMEKQYLVILSNCMSSYIPQLIPNDYEGFPVSRHRTLSKDMNTKKI